MATVSQKDFNVIMSIAMDIKQNENNIESDIVAAKTLDYYEKVYRTGNKLNEQDYGELLFQITYNLVNA